MPYYYYEVAECPQCTKMAIGKKSIEKAFGYRYHGTMAQSWCRDCRNAARHAIYLRAKTEKLRGN